MSRKADVLKDGVW